MCVWLTLRSKLVFLQHGEAKESGIACVRSDHVAWIYMSPTPFYSKVTCRYYSSMSQYVSKLRVHKIQQLGILVCLASGNPVADFMGPLQSTQGALSETPEGTLAIKAASLLKIGILWSRRTSDSRIEKPPRTHEIPMKLLVLDVLDNLIVLGTQVGEPTQNISEFEILNVRTRC